MPEPLKIFLDTSTVKHSLRSQRRLQAKPHSLTLNGVTSEVLVHKLVDLDPVLKVDDVLRKEIDLLKDISLMAKKGQIELIWAFEAEFELLTILPLGAGGSDLFDAGIRMVEGPVDYSRQLSPLSPILGETWRSLRADFLRSLTHQRFRELQRACGANQGASVNENQLVDAYHIWCAEHAGASYFLTTDFKLCRLVRRHKTAPPRLSVVTPSELLLQLVP